MDINELFEQVKRDRKERYDQLEARFEATRKSVLEELKEIAGEKKEYDIKDIFAYVEKKYSAKRINLAECKECLKEVGSSDENFISLASEGEIDDREPYRMYKLPIKEYGNNYRGSQIPVLVMNYLNGKLTGFWIGYNKIGYYDLLRELSTLTTSNTKWY